MGDVPAANHPPSSNLPMLYYGLVVVATAAIVLVIYDLVIIKWCASRRRATCRRQASGVSFEYKSGGDGDSECVVCLSVFEEGEQVKKLPKCGHCFHGPCIDMWLDSHFDCPLCRSPVGPPQHDALAPTSPHQHTITVQSEHSREILLGSAIFA